MNRRGCNPESFSCHPVSLGGIEASDFAALDELAVKLICVDRRFAKPLLEVGRLFAYRIADEVLLQIVGCVTALGWQVLHVGRTVCCFDAGLFEGVLCGVTGEDAWCVKETACLGLGNASCEFAIRREQNTKQKGVPHGQC